MAVHEVSWSAQDSGLSLRAVGTPLVLERQALLKLNLQVQTKCGPEGFSGGVCSRWNYTSDGLRQNSTMRERDDGNEHWVETRMLNRRQGSVNVLMKHLTGKNCLKRCHKERQSRQLICDNDNFKGIVWHFKIKRLFALSLREDWHHSHVCTINMKC